MNLNSMGSLFPMDLNQAPAQLDLRKQILFAAITRRLLVDFLQRRPHRQTSFKL
jgi:hypothetical protein